MFRLTGSVSFVAHTLRDPRAMGARRAARWAAEARRREGTGRREGDLGQLSFQGNGRSSDPSRRCSRFRRTRHGTFRAKCQRRCWNGYRDALLRAALERLIEYLLESAGAATLLMVKEAIVKTVG